MGLRALLTRQRRDLQEIEKIAADGKLRTILQRAYKRLDEVETQLHQLKPIDHSKPIPRAGIDFAFGRPSSLSSLRLAGVTFVGRYLGGSPDKDLTLVEAEDYTHADIDIITVFESTAQRSLDGEQAGAEDAKQAERQLRAIGAPSHAAVYFAVDYEYLGQPATLAYLRGAADVLGYERTGVYGSIRIINDALALKIVKYGWQTYAWSHGAWSSRAQLRQTHNNITVAGIACDQDEAVAADFGQWQTA